MRDLLGMDRVFRFTFVQHWKKKSLLRATVIVAVLCFLLPALIMAAVELFSRDDAAQSPESSTDAAESSLRTVYVVDDTDTASVDMSFLNAFWSAEGRAPLTYHDLGDDSEAALSRSEGDRFSLVLYLTEAEGTYAARVLMPEDSELEEQDASAYTAFVRGMLPYILAVKMDVDPMRVAQLLAPSSVTHVGGMVEHTPEELPEDAPASPQEATRELLAILLPYFNVMLLYFMVLFYGQGVANSIILEKSSKLVDTLLVTVRPGALVMGKLLAIALSGILQLLTWLAALFGGFAVGGVLVKMISPDTQNGLLLLMEQTDLWKGMFSLPVILVAILMLGGGFLLYCALAAIGGSMASKPEELSSTNSIFTMVLIISFLCTLYAGGIGEGMSSSASWLNWVPFTAVLVTPSRLLIGELSFGGALLALGEVLLTAFLLVLLAGRVYRLLILYKGKVPKLGDVLKMMRNGS